MRVTEWSVVLGILSARYKLEANAIACLLYCNLAYELLLWHLSVSFVD